MPTALPRGVLVAFEGIDGSGKSTQATLLADWATQRGLDVVRTREPTNGPWGQKVRESKVSGRLSPGEELQCFLEDRKEHVATLIAPALARGAIVIIDRYYYSTAAYQGARGHDPKALLAQNRAFAPRPDVVFLMDVDPRAGVDRIHARGGGVDAFETLPALTRAREIFLSLDEPHIITLDARKDPQALHASVLFHLLQGPLKDSARQLGLDELPEAPSLRLR
ncbi:MAG: dTMP kinase [Myxococcaceae bacterium]|nr:dTMP kinase [Myxococcaceae bacterium]